MLDEIIDILNEDLTVFKTCLKSEAHTYGHLHASVHIWFYTLDGKVLLQKRSSNKIAFPNLWDVSVAGHISSGENEINSAIREVEEEIGLLVSESDLMKIGVFKEQFEHTNDFIDNEIHHVYFCKLPCTIDLLSIQVEEVSALKLISIEDFIELRNQSGFEEKYVPHYKTYYDFILKKLKESISSNK